MRPEETMMRYFRSLALGLITAAVLAPLALSPSAQEMRRSAAVAVRAADRTAARDLAAATPDSVGISSQRLRRIDEAMKRLVDEKRVAGLVTLLERHGKVVHHSAVGQLDVRKADPVQKDSIFRIYSMTKPVTGVAMMMLHEEGKWRLDDPVARYIPEFARLKVYTGKNDDGTPKLEDARRSMTMRELMTHTGGLGYVLNPNNPVDKMIIDGNILSTKAPLQTMIDGLAKTPLLAQPGTRWSYSIGVDVQGYHVEK
jgi:CubicO group peptidase (beta-lactamase class C family)